MSVSTFIFFSWDSGLSAASRDRVHLQRRVGAVDERSRGELISLVYEELRQAASRLMRLERPDHTLSPTAVVNEAVIRLVGDAVFDQAPDRRVLYAAASRVMREILIDHARRRAAERRGGRWRRVPFEAAAGAAESVGLDALAVHEALDGLSRLSGRQSQVVTLRYFGGLTVSEVAEALGVSPVTVERDWRLARAWLHSQLRDHVE
jgi:RNA polymerase sigma-70 factor, ECF subfamily